MPQKKLTLADFDYLLPPQLIAQAPLPARSASRLLTVDGTRIEDRHIPDLVRLLQPGDLLEVHCTDPLSVIDIPNLIRETGDKVEITERAERRIVFLIEKTDGAGTQAG